MDMNGTDSDVPPQKVSLFKKTEWGERTHVRKILRNFADILSGMTWSKYNSAAGPLSDNYTSTTHESGFPHHFEGNFYYISLLLKNTQFILDRLPGLKV